MQSYLSSLRIISDSPKTTGFYLSTDTYTTPDPLPFARLTLDQWARGEEALKTPRATGGFTSHRSTRPALGHLPPLIVWLSAHPILTNWGIGNTTISRMHYKVIFFFSGHAILNCRLEAQLPRTQYPGAASYTQYKTQGENQISPSKHTPNGKLSYGLKVKEEATCHVESWSHVCSFEARTAWGEGTLGRAPLGRLTCCIPLHTSLKQRKPHWQTSSQVLRMGVCKWRVTLIDWLTVHVCSEESL